MGCDLGPTDVERQYAPGYRLSRNSSFAAIIEDTFSAVSRAILDSIGNIFGIAAFESRHEPTEKAVVRVVVQRVVGSSIFRLQSQQLVAGFLAHHSRLSNFVTVFVPDRQGSFAFFQQRLIFLADPRFDILWIAHGRHLSWIAVHFARQYR